MGHWGVKSYEIDEAADAIDAAMEQVHGRAYIELMEDDNPMTVEQIQKKLADGRTLAAAVEALAEQSGRPEAEWDEIERLAFVGIVVRHAELDVPVPAGLRDRAVEWIEGEEIEWDETTKRQLRRQKELAILKGSRAPSA